MVTRHPLSTCYFLVAHLFVAFCFGNKISNSDWVLVNPKNVSFDGDHTCNISIQHGSRNVQGAQIYQQPSFQNPRLDQDKYSRHIYNQVPTEFSYFQGNLWKQFSNGNGLGQLQQLNRAQSLSSFPKGTIKIWVRNQIHECNVSWAKKQRIRPDFFSNTPNDSNHWGIAFILNM